MGREPNEHPEEGWDRRNILAALGSSVAVGAGLFAWPWTLGSRVEGAPFPPAEDPARSFFRAIQQGDLPAVKRFLDGDSKLLSARDDARRSPLVVACLSGSIPVFEYLLEQGPTLDLVEAVLADDRDRVTQLASAHPERVNDLHPIGGTALFAAAKFGRSKLIFALNQWGADPNANPLGSRGRSALRAAFDGEDLGARRFIVTSLLGDAGNPNTPQKDADSVLHAAARIGDTDLIRMLLRKHADPSLRNVRGETPHDIAVAEGHSQAAEMLRNHAAIPRDLPRDGSSSRFSYEGKGGGGGLRKIDVPQTRINEFTAICHFNFDRLKEMVEETPEVIHGISSWNEMGVEATAHMARQDMTEFLLDRRAPCSILTAIMMGAIDRVRTLISDNPALVRERGPHDFPLMWYPQMAKKNAIELATLLVESGADVNQENRGFTVLHRCAQHGSVDLARFLMENGADLRAVGETFDGKRGTPLEIAKMFEQEQMIRLLTQPIRG